MSRETNKLAKEIKALSDKCNDKHVRVIQAILSGDYGSNQDAYMSEYPDSNKDSAKDSASKLLTIPYNNDLYQALKNLAFSENIMRREEAKSHLSDMARTKISDLCIWCKVEIGKDEDGNTIEQSAWVLKDSVSLDDKQMRAIKELKSTPQGMAIVLHDQKQAIKQLADMQGWDAPTETHEKLTIVIENADANA